jgi:pimeloyl-ACP methyl ester carboxylesterase
LLRKSSELNGRRVRYYEAGEGDAVVLLHGAGATARLWRKQIAPLSGLFKVLAPDLPGFGDTDVFPEIKDVRGYSGFLAAFLEKAGVSRVSLVGSSMGGWAACWFALIYPEKVDKLVLVSPAGVYRPEDPPMPLPSLLEEIKAWYEKVSDPVMGSGAKRELEKGISTIERLSASGGLEPDIQGRLSEIKAETLVIWGEDDRVIPVSYATVFKRGIKGSGLRIIKGAGHMPYIEKAEIFNDAIIDYIKRGSLK